MLKTLTIPERARNVGLAVAVAAFAAMLTAFYVSNYKKNVQQDQNDIPVLVAKKNIEPGTLGSEVIAKQLAVVEEIPRRTVVVGAYSNVDQVQGLITSEQIYPGEQITARRFRPKVERGIRAKLQGNLRAMQLAGDVNQVLAGTLAAGDRVDVVANVKYKVFLAGGREVDRTATRVVLRDILVLKAAPRADSGSVTSSDEQSVQLAVTDAQAQKLLYVIRNGDWTLDLRAASRATDGPESVETVESVLGDGLRARQRDKLVGGSIR